METFHVHGIKIVFLVIGMYSGGAERVISNLANHYVRDNNVTIISCMQCKSEYPLDAKITYYCLDASKEDRYKNKPVRLIARRKALIQILKNIQPDVTISFLPEPCMIAVLAGRKFTGKLIVSERDDPATLYGHGLTSRIFNLVYGKADGFVLQTQGAYDYFNTRTVKKATIIPNPLNPVYLDVHFQPEKNKTITMVGRIERKKNYVLAINAFAKIADKYQGWKLAIYGSKTDTVEIEKLIARLDLRDRIELCGRIDDVKSVLLTAGVYLLSSDYEGMPNALMEAMACGAPSISTDCPCGGPNDLIEDGVNGLLVSVKDVDALASALDRLISDREYANRLGENAMEIAERLNPKRIYSMWDECINSVLTNGI